MMLKKLKGIDISEHQGNIQLENWQKIKRQVDYIILRSSHGMHSEDKQWQNNYRMAKSVGLPVGAYHYFYYADPAKNSREVDNFVAKLEGKELDLPAFIDCEDPDLGRLKRDQITGYALNAFESIQNAGCKAGIYANKYWLETKLQPEKFPEHITVWLAQYAPLPTYKKRFDIWQYTSQGRIDGISGYVDMNYWYYREEKVIIPGDVCPYPEPTTIFPHHKSFTGSAARWFQWHLIRAGYDCGVNPADADQYGTDGLAYGKTWQSIDAVVVKAGLTPGDAGPKTRAAIKKAAGF